MESLAELGYEDVVTLTDGGGSYDWSEMHVFTKDGRVFVNSQSGCSCSSWEEPDAGDLVEVATMEQARSQWLDMMGSYANDDEWLNVRPTFAELGLR